MAIVRDFRREKCPLLKEEAYVSDMIFFVKTYVSRI